MCDVFIEVWCSACMFHLLGHLNDYTVLIVNLYFFGIPDFSRETLYIFVLIDVTLCVPYTVITLEDNKMISSDNLM